LTSEPRTYEGFSARTEREKDSSRVAEVPSRDPGQYESDPANGALTRRFDELSSEVAELRHLIKSPTKPISTMLQHQVLGEPFSRLLWQEGLEEFDSQRADLVSAEFQRLISLGLDENVAFFLNRSASRELSHGEDGKVQFRRGLNQAISEMIQVAPVGPLEGAAGNIAAFIGPTGVGKTTTIAKLAARFALKEQKKVRLLTLDTYRIAAAEQLKTYGEIIGVPVRVILSVDELNDVVNGAQEEDFLLIDTIGHSHKKVSEYVQLAHYLSRNERIQKHLVLSTATNPSDLRETIESFEAFGPDSLVFTKLDESSSHGVIVNELVRTRKPLSCLTNGQNVPEDLILPMTQTVADMVVPAN
jgi:flagellar biosynthesis protein FlhF